MNIAKRNAPVMVLICALVYSACGLLPHAWAQGAQQFSGSLRIKTDASDVQVLLDGKEVGRTPLTLRQVGAGKHQLLLVKQGYDDYTQEVEISSAKPASLFVVMKPNNITLPELPVQFKVIHQHRFGSCFGALVVSAEALDYKAENDEDKFHIPIRTIKSVARSWGPTVGVIGINAPTDIMALRIETPGRSYGFMAFKDTVDDPIAVASVKTKELFEVVYKLWSATLAPQAKKRKEQ